MSVTKSEAIYALKQVVERCEHMMDTARRIAQKHGGDDELLDDLDSIHNNESAMIDIDFAREIINESGWEIDAEPEYENEEEEFA